jgi:hypothetical protein
MSSVKFLLFSVFTLVLAPKFGNTQIILPQKDTATFSFDQWRFKRLFAQRQLKPGIRISENILTNNYLNYYFIKVVRPIYDSIYKIENYHNKEGNSDPFYEIFINEKKYETSGKVTKPSPDNTNLDIVEYYRMAFENYFPTNNLIDVLKNKKIILKLPDQPRNIISRRPPRQLKMDILTTLERIDTLVIDIGGKKNKNLCFLIKQQIKGKGYYETKDNCPSVIDIERTYWVLNNVYDPIILKFEEYHAVYRDNEVANQFCRCPRGSTRYRANQIIEIFPK